MLFKYTVKQLSIVLFISTVLFNTRAQDLRIPFRIGDKFGLSNESGELKVSAVYDHIEFMEETFQYFQYTNVQYDSSETAYGTWEPDEKYTTGVIFNDQVIIDNKPYPHFRLYDKYFIVGSTFNNQRPENCMLYNLRGEELIDSEMKSIYFNSERDIGKLRFADTNLVLISMFHADERRNYRFSLVSYDVQKQAIKQWILKKVSNYERVEYNDVEEDLAGKLAITILYNDENGKYDKILYYDPTSKEFKLSLEADNIPDAVSTDSDRQRLEDEEAGSRSSILRISWIVSEPNIESEDQKMTRPTRTENYEGFSFTQGGALYYGDKKVVNISGATYQMINTRSQVGRQNFPVIYQLNSKYGLVFSDVSHTKAIYDSLFYMTGSIDQGKTISHFYLLGTKNRKNLTWKYGVMNHLGEIILPVEYDCLLPFVPKLTWEYFQEGFSEPLNFFTTPQQEFLGSTKTNAFYRVDANGLIAVKNGHVGIISQDFQVSLPCEYDGFYYNDISYTHPVRSNGDFMIAAKNGQYAMIKDLSISQQELDKKFIFPYLPGSYYPNYGGKEEFHLVRLITPDGTFCYATIEGLIYYQQQ